METREDGSTIERGFIVDGDRYWFDAGMCSRKNGWIQYDTEQDAWYFGIWVNPEKRQIFTYAEGDTSLETFPTEESFQEGLKKMADFYGPPPPSMRAIGMDGSMTHYYDTDGMFGRKVEGLN